MKAGRQRLGISTEFSMGPELEVFDVRSMMEKCGGGGSFGGLQPAHPMEVWKLGLGVWNYDTMIYWRRPKATGLQGLCHGSGSRTRYEGCSCGSFCCPNRGGSLVFLDLILCLHTH